MYDHPFVRNAWYVAAASHEIGRELTRRWMLEEPLVLYRTEAGAVAALADRCSHRRYPLSRGTLIGDSVECAYHGFTFNATGACIAIPAETGNISARACVRAYPAVERGGWIWLWMGEPTRADDTEIPDCSWIDNPAHSGFSGSFEVKGRYELMVENLLDLTHLTFIHSTSIGNSYYARAPIMSEIDDGKVRVKRMMPGVELPPFHAKTMGLTNPVDRWNITEYVPPAFVTVRVGACAAGNPQDSRENRVTNAITPRTRTTHTYFWNVTFDYPIDVEHTREAVTRVLSEDVAAVEAQEEMVVSDREDAFEYSTQTDAGVVRARRIRHEMLQREAEDRSR